MPVDGFDPGAMFVLLVVLALLASLRDRCAWRPSAGPSWQCAGSC
jgi:hypothetical protein